MADFNTLLSIESSVQKPHVEIIQKENGLLCSPISGWGDNKKNKGFNLSILCSNTGRCKWTIRNERLYASTLSLSLSLQDSSAPEDHGLDVLYRRCTRRDVRPKSKLPIVSRCSQAGITARACITLILNRTSSHRAVSLHRRLR